MLLDKLLSLFIYPLGLSLLLGLTGLLLGIFRRRRLAAGLSGLALGWLFLWSLPPVADALTYTLEKQSKDRPAGSLPKADVILVFGGTMRPALPGHPYPDMGQTADRAWHAARLYHAGRAPVVLLSGGRFGWQKDLPSEAESMAHLLRALGVPDSALIQEEQSLNTYQNAVYCARAMQTAGFQSALLVTSALHMPRSLAVARAAGINAVPAATDFLVTTRRNPLRYIPSAEGLQRSTHAIHEWVGMLVYKGRGWM